MTDADLVAIERRVEAASPGPWTSYVEGRDHMSGDDFIRVSELDTESDMYVSRSTERGLTPASTADQDFIAHARQDVPRLIAELRRLRTRTVVLQADRSPMPVVFEMRGQTFVVPPQGHVRLVLSGPDDATLTVGYGENGVSLLRDLSLDVRVYDEGGVEIAVEGFA